MVMSGIPVRGVKPIGLIQCSNCGGYYGSGQGGLYQWETDMIRHALEKLEAREMGYVDAAIRALAARRGIKSGVTDSKTVPSALGT